MKKVLNVLFMTVSMSLFLYSQTSYGLTRYSGSGGGYKINLANNFVALANEPTIGSDGKPYYSITPIVQEGILVDQSTSQPYGVVNCKVNYLVGNYQSGLSGQYAFHRVFAYMPDAGVKIKGLTAYRINSNTFFTLYSANGITQGWKNLWGNVCGLQQVKSNTSNFITQFPFEIRFYIRDIPIDGRIIIPASMIAGYTRMFQYPGTPDMYIPADKATIKLDLEYSLLQVSAKCRSNIDNLNINHNTLDATKFNSKRTQTVTYQCEHTQSTKVKLAIDYVTDNDPQKRVPLKWGNNTIYADLSIYDAETNQRGKTINTTIGKVKNIQIDSELYGSNAEPGRYTGHAWLIATYL